MFRKALFAAALTAMTFAAHAQSPIGAHTPAPFADRWPPLFVDRWGTLPEPVRTEPVADRQVAVFSLASAVPEMTRASPAPSNNKQSERASYGLASYYGQGSRTASGEKF